MHPVQLAAVVLLTFGLVASPAEAKPGKGKGFGNGKGPIAAPAELGPHAVGRLTYDLVDPTRDDRTLPVDVWYPVDDADAVGGPAVYDLIFTGIESETAFDSPVVSSKGPFPLVVFSHGNAGIRFQSYFLMEHLASHGFVVAAPDHVGNTAIDILIPGTPFETRDRPLDVSLVITSMLDRSATGGDAFEGRISADQVGVAGHSFGGFTTLVMATGFQDVPPDERVRVLMPISPASGGVSDAALSSIGLPTMLISGTADTTTPIDNQTTRPWELIPARPRYRVDVIEAGHNSFTDICAIGDALLDAGLPPNLLGFLLGNLEEGCSPDLIDIARAQELTQLYATAYLKRNLAGDPRYSRFLTPATARKLGDVVYFRVPGCSDGVGAGTIFGIVLLLGWRGRPSRRA